MSKDGSTTPTAQADTEDGSQSPTRDTKDGSQSPTRLTPLSRKNTDIFASLSEATVSLAQGTFETKYDLNRPERKITFFGQYPTDPGERQSSEGTVA
jgi:hypothetical protein